MSIFVSAILSELASRSISFLIDRSIRLSTAPPTVGEALNSLQRLLLRAQVVVEEAEARLVANWAMLQLLNRLRLEMYRAHHTLDSCRCRANDGQGRQDQAVQVIRSGFAPSSFNPAKRFRFCTGSAGEQRERIDEAVGRLEIAMRDAGELVVFLAGCPRLHRQPYNTYLLLDKCVFGRQMEMERIISFLLEEVVPGADEHLGVLPVIGPGKVGKTTMIECACNDERVRNRFSRIVCFSQDSMKDRRKVAALSDCDVVKHHNPAVTEESRVLVVIELIWEIDEGAWIEFYSDCKRRLASGSKIIVAGRSEAMAGFGTAPALRVPSVSEEAYWYFFKVRTFGSTDAEDHPRLASIAMEMARELNGCFFSGHLHSGLMRANFDIRFWSMALAVVKEFKRMNRFLLYGCSHFVYPWQVVEPVYMMSKDSSEYLVILDDYQTASMQSPEQSGAPFVDIKDILLGRVRPRGKFKVLAWRSHLPPYYSYVLNCEVRRRQQGLAVSRKKRVS